MSSSSTSTPTRYRLKRSIRTADSSDTDITPPRKRSRRGRSSTDETPDCDLCDVLCRRNYNPKDDTAIEDFKSMKKLKREQDTIYAIQDIIKTVRAAVKTDVQTKGRKILEVELYLKWLEGFDFVVRGIESLLSAKDPDTRQYVHGLGRLCFSILYHLIDGFIDEVNAHQDGWSFQYPTGPVEHDPLVMTFAEESNDESMDGRCEDAVQSAELLLQRYDKVMVAALRRYKLECNRKLVAVAIERKEDSLSRACCLLSEQTGYGGTEGMEFKLLVETREAMAAWKTKA